MDAEFLKMLIALAGMAGVLIAPSVYYLRYNSNKQDERTKELLKDIQTKNKESIDSFANTLSEANTSLRYELKEFRQHFDTRFSDVYNTVDSKTRDLRDHISKDLDFLKSHVGNLEKRIETQSEKSHSIEKDILRLENVLSKEYISKDQLDILLQVHKVKPA